MGAVAHLLPLRLSGYNSRAGLWLASACSSCVPFSPKGQPKKKAGQRLAVFPPPPSTQEPMNLQSFFDWGRSLFGEGFTSTVQRTVASLFRDDKKPKMVPAPLPDL